MLAVEHNDLIVFEKVDIKTFKLKYIKGHHRTYVNPMFYCVMMDTESKDLVLFSYFIYLYCIFLNYFVTLCILNIFSSTASFRLHGKLFQE
ncbi:hypothetical protein Hanom_Chr13g01236401 [Helianthus anomalus]